MTADVEIESSGTGALARDFTPRRSMLLALRVMQAGAIAVVLAVCDVKLFELDRFFIPKEFVLHGTALLSLLFTWRRVTISKVDRLLLPFIVLSAISAAWSTNPWLGLRGLAIGASGVALFWSARALRVEGLDARLLRALAVAIVIIAATSLLQAYGIEIDYFSESRAPGGTLGNRNFVAHAAAFGLPLLILAASRAKTRAAWLRWAIGIALVCAALVLTRSRAAWLAFGTVVLVLFFANLLSAPLRRSGAHWRRMLGMVSIAAAGILLALVLPNALRWNSDNPYLESVKRVADYSEGSGHGRLVQYRRSLNLAAHHPLFGVGPGNWAVEYPSRVPADDPSMNPSESGTTFNPWPSSDWIAFVAERGPIATLLLFGAFIVLALQALRRLARATDADEALVAAALLGTLAGAGVTGLFDAVLLVALPSLILWTAFGALAAQVEVVPTRRARLGIAFVLLLVLAGSVRSAMQLGAMEIYDDRGGLREAVKLDPANYRLQLRLARSGNRASRCEHARAAHALYPHAAAGANLARGCR
jgi:O-antigen ligase